jgi:hypothetical protein
VTNGRFLQDPAYDPSTFKARTLTAQPNPANNQPLMPTGTVTGTGADAIATLTLQNSNNPPQQIQVPWLPGRPFSFTASTPLGNVNGVGFVDQAGQFFAYNFTGANNLNFSVFGGTPTATANFPKTTPGQPTTVGAQQLVNLGAPGNIPFAPNSVGGDSQLKGAASTSPLYTIYGAQPSQSKSLQVTISVAGTGASQKSYMGVFIANYGVNPADNSLYSTGTYGGSYRMGGDQGIGTLRSTAATAATGQGQGTAIYGDTGQYMTYVPDRIVPTRSGGTSGTTLANLGSSPPGVQRVPGASANQTPNGATSSYYPITAVAPATPDQVNPNTGQNRTAQTMVGYLGGLVDTNTGNRMLVSQLGDVTISTDPATNQAQGKLILRYYDGSVFDPTKLTLQLGGGSNKFGPTSAFIDNNTYAMTTHGRSTMQVGDNTARVKNSTVLASANAAPVQLPNMGSCTCDYLSWGWWSTNAKTKGDGPLSGNNARTNLGTYVAGTLTTAVQMPTMGQATYSGLMAGNVNNAGNSYVAGGNFSLVYDYQKRVGGITSMTFDNARYSGGIVGTGDGTSHVGAFAGQNGVGTMKGSFYGPGAANIGGTFGITGTNPAYQASGIYAGQKR